MPIFGKLKRLKPEVWLSVSITFLLFLSIVFTQFATTNSRDSRSLAAGFTNKTITWTDNIRFRDRICLAGTSTCQPWRIKTGTSDTWTVASLVSYDLHVEIGHDGSTWYFWEKQNNWGRNCFGPTTCSHTVNWAQADYIIRTTLDNTDHSVRRPTTSYTYNNVPADRSYTGTIDYKDYDNFGNRHTAYSIGGTTGPCTISCPVPEPTVDIKANGSNGPITISYNSAANLTWSTTNSPTSCSASNGWSGSKSVSGGSQSTGNLTSSRTYTINCSNSGGSDSDSVTVNVGPAPPPPPGGGTPPPGGSTPPPTTKPPTTSPPTSKPPGGSTRPTQTFSKDAVKGSSRPITSTNANEIVIQSGKNPFLVGAKEIDLSIEGTSVTKKIIITSENEYFQIGVPGLGVGNNYTMKLSGEWLVPQSQVFKLNQSGTNLSLSPLLIGDLNKDNVIAEVDAIDFLNGFLGDKFYDLNSDGTINSFDYSILINNIKNQ